MSHPELGLDLGFLTGSPFYELRVGRLMKPSPQEERHDVKTLWQHVEFQPDVMNRSVETFLSRRTTRVFLASRGPVSAAVSRSMIEAQ